MCHFITATLSADGDEEAVRELAESHGLKWDEIERPAIGKDLLPGERYFLTTRGMCDCGTSIGMCQRSESTSPPDYSREIKQFQKQGWSTTKINRWLADKQTHLARQQAEANRQRQEPYPDLERWRGFVTSVLEGAAASHVGLLLHFYKGSPISERIVLRERRWLALHDLTDDYLLNAAEDQIHTVTLKPRAN